MTELYILSQTWNASYKQNWSHQPVSSYSQIGLAESYILKVTYFWIVSFVTFLFFCFHTCLSPQRAVERSIYLQPRALPYCRRHWGEQAGGGEDDGFRNGKAPLHRRSYCTAWSLPLPGNSHPKVALCPCSWKDTGPDPRVWTHNETQTLSCESHIACTEWGVRLFELIKFARLS